MMASDQIKTRIFPESNYKGIYHNGKTLRVALDPNKPITELEYPEFWDVKITNKCNGNCPYCYQNSKPDEDHPLLIVQKIYSFFGRNMNENQRPFQVAIGGGEPTLHPFFIPILRTFCDLGITPNYTTNGTSITEEILDATEDYCGGIALSCHPHLKWSQSLEKFFDRGIKTNLHIIISDIHSINRFAELYKKYRGYVDYFVLLPYIAKGRAQPQEIDYEYLSKELEYMDRSQIAFGARFHNYLMNKRDWDISLYPPEMLSKYIDMTDMSIHKSSFE